MLYALFAIATLFAADTTTPMIGGAKSPPETAAKTDRFAGRPQARIAFNHEVSNFQVEREGYDDILYLETRRDRWYRSKINCFGIADPRDAQGLLSLDRMSGFDNFTRIGLVSFGHRTTECRLNDLIELTREEAIDLRLVRVRAARAVKPTPAS
jgi:hypothetical protein